MKDYSHLNKTVRTEYDWQNNLMGKALGSRAFTNELTGNMMLSYERILTIVISSINYIRTYRRL